jgi:signal transduction histidine kinase
VTNAPNTGYFVVAALALGFVDGVTAMLMYPGQVLPLSSFAIDVVVLLITFAWYRLDSDSRDYKRSLLSSAMVIGAGIFVLPYYFFRTRGLRRGALATLIFLLIAMGYSVLSYLGQRAAFALRT